MIPILASNAWREFRGPPPTKGLNQTTHLASIADPAGKIHKCFVKMTPPNWPTPITESLAWLLAEALDLPRPEFAAIVLVPIPKLKQYLTLDQHWLQYNEYPAFCSSAVDGKSPASGFRWISAMRLRRLFSRPEIARICAFDQWVENQDRHSGNLLVRQSGEHVPIDNELILYSLLWSGVGNFAFNSLLKDGSHRLTPSAFKRFMVEVAQSANQHQSALSKATPRMEATISALVNDPAAAEALKSKIMDFLGVRANQTWMPKNLGVIV